MFFKFFCQITKTHLCLVSFCHFSNKEISRTNWKCVWGWVVQSLLFQSCPGINFLQERQKVIWANIQKGERAIYLNLHFDIFHLSWSKISCYFSNMKLSKQMFWKVDKRRWLVSHKLDEKFKKHKPARKVCWKVWKAQGCRFARKLKEHQQALFVQSLST